MESHSFAQMNVPQASQEEVVNYRYLALGLLSARVYTEDTAELISECAVLDFDRDGVALILPEEQVRPDQRVRLSLARKNVARNAREELAISFVPGNVRYVSDIGNGVRVGVKLEYAGHHDIEDTFRRRAIEIENYLDRHHADAERMAFSAYKVPEGYQIGGRMKYAI